MVVEVKDLSFVERVQNISFCVDKGECLAILGPSGAGKSTILSLLSSLLTPSKGSIERSKEFGYLFQESDLQLFESTVYKEVSYSLRAQKKEKALIVTEVKKALLKVGLNYSNYEKLTPFVLSGGEKKRIALASILVQNPSLLLLDEPTVGLDGKSSTQFYEIINNLKQEGKALIVVTHDLTLVEKCADKVLKLNKGEGTYYVSTASYFEQFNNLTPITRLSEKLELGRIYQYERFLDEIARRLNV